MVGTRSGRDLAPCERYRSNEVHKIDEELLPREGDREDGRHKDWEIRRCGERDTIRPGETKREEDSDEERETYWTFAIRLEV